MLNLLRTTWVVAVLLVAGVGYAARPKASANVYEGSSRMAKTSAIDRIVVAKLTSLSIHPTYCSDAVFLRRVYLDALGTLPTAKEARTFLDDKDLANKRSKLIDRLLERDEFIDFQSMKWGDTLRIKAEFPVNLWPDAARSYHRWVHASLAANKPYDKMVRELLTSSGSNFRVGQSNFYRAVQGRSPESIAAAVALTLMGSRIDTWPEDRRKGLATVFSQVGFKPTSEWKEEIVFWDPYHLSKVRGVAGKASLAPTAPPAAPPPAAAPAAAKPEAELRAPAPLTAMFPDGKVATIPPTRDPRDYFAMWLIRPENPWFAKCLVNRVWAWLLGRGIIHEPDDIRDDNPPVIPELLAHLEEEFVKSNYDIKGLYRMILNSKTYQASSVQRTKNTKAEVYFGCYNVRRLDAEVLIDALNKVTGTTDLYTSAVPEPFTYIPSDMSAVAIADASITNSFLALFGRSARATGQFDERASKPLAAQWRHLLNSSHIQKKLETGTLLETVNAGNRSPEQVIDELYLTILSRYPTKEEMGIIYEYVTRNLGDKGDKNAPPPAPGKLPQVTPAQRRDNAIDIAWALLNSTEFLFRH